MNDAERETLGLCIAVEALNDIANNALLEIRSNSAQFEDAEVYFHTHVHQELFLARLLDFSKESASSSITGVNGSCLDVIDAACATRSFDHNGSVSVLVETVAAFRDWLNHSATIEMWIPTLQIEAKIKVFRSVLVFVVGNHAKHNLARLSAVSREIGKLFRDHGCSVQDEQVPLALNDIREHLQANYFVYYGSWLAELVNNLRWGIQGYLAPVFSQSYSEVAGDRDRYEYEYPSDIVDALAREWFWRLMNHVRAQPCLEKFTVAPYLKTKASIENSDG